MSLKRESLKRRRSSKAKAEPKLDEDTQFGFENRAFMPQHILLDNKYDVELGPRYCSLAHFVEGGNCHFNSIKIYTVKLYILYLYTKPKWFCIQIQNV